MLPGFVEVGRDCGGEISGKEEKTPDIIWPYTFLVILDVLIYARLYTPLLY
jgi:hypothetical protein